CPSRQSRGDGLAFRDHRVGVVAFDDSAGRTGIEAAARPRHCQRETSRSALTVAGARTQVRTFRARMHGERMIDVDEYLHGVPPGAARHRVMMRGDSVTGAHAAVTGK